MISPVKVTEYFNDGHCVLHPRRDLTHHTLSTLTDEKKMR